MSDEATIDILDLLKKPMSEFPDLPNLPARRTFIGKLIDMKAGFAANEKKTPRYEFGIRITDAGKDVTPSEMAVIANSGFGLADYTVGTHFYLTPQSLRMLRAFLTSLGFPENASFYENLKLSEMGEPTMETQEIIRGRDVMFTTPRPGENGRVYLGNVDNVVGIKL